MIFNKTYSFETQKDINVLKQKLMESLIEVKNQPFFVSAKDNMLRIIPDASNRHELTTLPVTHVKFKSKSGSEKTKITLFSKPRKIDAGGPYLLVIFCVFLLLAAAIIYFVNPARSNYVPAMCLAILSLTIGIIFMIRMLNGYYGYVRGIKQEIRKIAIH